MLHTYHLIIIDTSHLNIYYNMPTCWLMRKKSCSCCNLTVGEILSDCRKPLEFNRDASYLDKLFSPPARAAGQLLCNANSAKQKLVKTGYVCLEVAWKNGVLASTTNAAFIKSLFSFCTKSFAEHEYPKTHLVIIHRSLLPNWLFFC